MWVTPEGSTVRQETASMQEGRGRLVFWSSLYGIWLGIATDVLFDINGNRSVILPPLLGMGAGLGLSLALTADIPISAGQAWTIITGLDYGSINGALWAGGLDFGTKGIVGTAVAFGIAAAAAGLADRRRQRPHPRRHRAGSLRPAVGSGRRRPGRRRLSDRLRARADSPSCSGPRSRWTSGSSPGSRWRGGSSCRATACSSSTRARSGGRRLGLGIAWLAGNGSGEHGRVLAGSTLAGLDRRASRSPPTVPVTSTPAAPRQFASAVPAIWARDPDGRWRAGTPTPLPVWGGAGTRLVGATVNAVAGTF